MSRRKSNVIQEVRFGFSKPQHDFLTALEAYVALVAGFGSGKTLVGLSRIFQNMAQAAAVGDGTIDQAYLAPTYSLIRDIFYPAVDAMMLKFGIEYDINKSNHTVELDGLGKILCRTMDKPEKIVGWEVADAVLDEFDVLKIDKAIEVFYKTDARCRQVNPTGRINQLFITTTPEGFKATYKLFKKDPLEDSRLIQMSTYSNQKNLPANYISKLKKLYPPQLIEAYLNGEFVNLTTGSVYNEYDRVRNRSTETIREKEDLIIGQDFNIGKMASSIFVIRDNGWHLVSELCDLMDTPKLISVLREKFEGHRITIYPDASGGNRSTSDASKSDISMLKLAGFTVKANKKNPFVKDRVLAVNQAFNQQKVWVNDSAAPIAASSLEQQVYDDNGAPDKKSGVDHSNDATGYPIVYEMPINKPVIVTGISSAV